MKNYQPVMSFGADVAGMFGNVQRGDEADAVQFLYERAAGGPALELGIGAGRIALPLAARGVRVNGIDLSPAMVEQLRSRPGGDEIEVSIGNFADVAVSGSYRLVYVVWNTLFNLLSQDEQLRCFENVAAHLDDGGSFVIEAFVPAWLYRLPDNQYVEAEAIEVGEVRLDVARHDPVAQLLDESHVVLSPEGIRLNPVVTRYAWPAELDLMARIAGLRPRERWGGWNKRPFTAGSRQHVSVYGR